MNLNNRPKIIGLMGAAGAGKDTVATMVREHHPRLVRVDACANPLYDGLATMLGVSPEYLRDRNAKEMPHSRLGVSPRVMLQTLGTEWGRNTISPDIWIDLALERHHERLRRSPYIVTILTDIRFTNEAEALRKAGGRLVHVIRPDVAPVETHVSETAIDRGKEADYTLRNDGSLDRLRERVKAAVDVGAF